MAELQEDKLDNEIVIDFDQLANPELKESFLASFGFMVKGLLKAIFGQSHPPKTTIRGKPIYLDRFAKALGAERDYLSTLQKYDLDNPQTHKNKAKLKNSVKRFEQDTGIKWPFEV